MSRDRQIRLLKRHKLILEIREGKKSVHGVEEGNGGKEIFKINLKSEAQILKSRVFRSYTNTELSQVRRSFHPSYPSVKHC